MEALDEPRVVPEAVYREVVTEGLGAGYDDARRVGKAVESGRFTVVDAEVEGIKTRRTASVVLGVVKRGELSLEDGRETIDAMVNAD